MSIMADNVLLAKHHRELGDKYMNNNSPEKSFFHYLIAFQLLPHLKNDLKTSFSSCLCSYGKILEQEGKYDELFASYEQSLKIYPDDEVILNNLGAHLCRLQHLKEALIYFKKALKVNQYYLPAYRNLEITKSHLVERWHFRMLNDTIRNASYERSISKKIKSGCNSVLDIGTGTGLLSIYAQKAGASCIYSCDYSPTMISIAEKVLNYNSLSDSVILINKLSNELSVPEDIPQRLSMVVTETFDGGLLGEHILETLIHAWEHLLEPILSKGQMVERVIPYNAVLFITPIESVHIARKNRLIDIIRLERNSYREGLDLSGLKLFTQSSEPYDTENLKNITFRTLGPTKKLFEFNFNDVSELKKFYGGEKDNYFSIELDKEGFFDAIAVWFDLFLDSETSITSSPFSKECCCWEQAVFPVKNKLITGNCSIPAFVSCLGGMLSISLEQNNSMEKEKLDVSESIMRLLNCETTLLTFIDVFKYIKYTYNPDEISVLDLSQFPYLGLLMAKNLNCTLNFSNQYFDVLPIIKEMLLHNMIDENKVNFKKWSEVLELLDTKNEKYNIILIEPLTTSGEIDEEVITLVPLLRNLLGVNGLFFPSKISIYCQLIFSEELANSSQMNSDNDELSIAEFINEYKVSHMIDFKLEELNYKKMSSHCAVAVLDINNIMNESYTFTKEIEVLEDGCVNAILYWYSVNYTTDIQFSTISPDSYINQAAVLLDNQIKTDKSFKLNVSLYYYSGAMKFVVL